MSCSTSDPIRSGSSQYLSSKSQKHTNSQTARRERETMNPLSSKPHMVLFPFMSKGHTIPLLHLAQLLLDRHVTVTIFTTPANHPFISQSLPCPDVSIVDLPFPATIPGIPPGTENTENLPSMSFFVSFVTGIKLMQPFFEEELRKIHSGVTCLVSDAFLPWTLDPASKFGIPRLTFYGMAHYTTAVVQDAFATGLIPLHDSDDEPFTLVKFPWIQLTRSHFDAPFNQREPGGPHFDFVVETGLAAARSYGLLVNSFYELERPFVELSQHGRTWSIGPLCLGKTEAAVSHKPKWMHWLDLKLAQGSPVLYIAFGSQAKLSPTQAREIALGLEESRVSFLWVVKSSVVELSDGFEERGMVVSEWVNQEEILEHSIVQGFVSHCGWNSVMEGICAGVPILAWPMMADQFLNAKAVVEEFKIGLGVRTVDGSPRGFVNAESLKKTVVELMEGERGNQLRAKVKELAAAARDAVADGGSSWRALNDFITDTHRQKEINGSHLNQQN